MTDINSDKSDGSKNTASIGNYNFVVPSYASGILDKVQAPQQDLLPPLSSGNYNFPSIANIDPSKIKVPSEISNYQQNEILSTFPTIPATSGPNVQAPVSGLLPPTSDLLPPSFSSPSVGSPLSQNTNKYATNPEQKQQNNLGPVKSAFAKPPTQDTGKYTGGFGGAPGVLGEQSKPGYAVQPAATGTAPVQTISAQSNVVTPPSYQQPPSPNTGNNFNPLAPPATSQQLPGHQPAGNYQGSAAKPPTGPQSPVYSLPSNNAAVARPGSESDKYTGGFGGPPGYLKPYDNLKNLPVGHTFTG